MSCCHPFNNARLFATAAGGAIVISIIAIWAYCFQAVLTTASTSERDTYGWFVCAHAMSTYSFTFSTPFTFLSSFRSSRRWQLWNDDSIGVSSPWPISELAVHSDAIFRFRWIEDRKPVEWFVINAATYTHSLISKASEFTWNMSQYVEDDCQ